MTPFATSSISIALLNCGLGIFFALVTLWRLREHFLWSLFCFGVGLWAAGLGLLTIAPNTGLATKFLLIHYFGAIFLLAIFYHFIHCFLKRRINRDVLFVYVAAAGLFSLALGGLLVNVQPHTEFRFYTSPGPVYFLFLIYLVPTIGYTHYLLYKQFKSADHVRRRQIHLLFIATGIGFLGGVSTILPVYDGPAFSWAMPLVFIYLVIFSYAILHHQLLNIRLALRDTTIYVLTGMILAGGVLAAVLPAAGQYPRAAVILATLSMGLLMVLAYDPIRKLIQPAIDRVVFANRFAYLEELANLPNDMLQFTNLREMLKFLVSRLVEAGKLKHAAVLMYDSPHQSYIETIRYPALDPSTNGNVQWTLGQRSPLLALVRGQKGLLSLEELQQGHFPDREAAISDLKSLAGTGCFGVMNEKELVGLVVLGEKTSGESFNQRDMKILEALKLRLENFLLQALVTTQESLNMVKDSHDMKNDVNAMRGRTGWKRQKIKRAKHALLQQIQTLLETSNEPQSAMLKMLEFEIVRFLDEQDGFIPIENDALDRLMLKLQNWSEYGRLVGEGFQGKRALAAIDVSAAAKMCHKRWQPVAERKGVEIVAETDGPLMVTAEQSLIEQILDNLVDNALKATEKGRVSLSCRQAGHQVVIEVSDTGCGIPEEHLDAILKKPFYQGRGRESLEKSTGIGLVLVNSYAKSIGGDVKVESARDRGTTFRVFLPLAKEALSTEKVA